jgi:diguanylate cyclase (GGDEF)-like protein/PAS domain S-box-containing protein
MKDHPKDEEEGLRLLTSLNVLETERENVFDSIVQISAEVCGTPMAFISLIDEGRQWIKAAIGVETMGTARSVPFSDRTIRSHAPFIVQDAAADPAFRANPLVAGLPHLRFYAGFPLVFPHGLVGGTLAVMDVVPRSLNHTQLTFLTVLSQQVVALLEMRRQREELRRAIGERDALNAALHEQAEHLKQAQRIARIGSWVLDPATGALTCSDTACELLAGARYGAPRSIDELLADVHDEDRNRMASAIAAATQCLSSALDHRIVLGNGSIRHMRTIVEARPQGEARTVVAGTLQDLNEEHLAQQRLQLLSAGVSRISDTVMITEADELDEPGPRIVFINEAFETLTGYRASEVLGKSPRMFQGPNTSRHELDRVRHALIAGAAVSAELINYRKDGREFWLEMNIFPVVNDNGRITHFISVQRDITARKAEAEEITRLAFYDQLTGLPNRRLLFDRLQHQLDLVQRTGSYGALMVLDLDNFKTTNDTLGHDTGDLLLQQVAHRLEGVARRSNTVARLGGDEFVVMLEDLAQDEQRAAARAELVGEKILDAFKHSFCLGHVQLHCTPSIGVTLFHSRLRDPKELFKRADVALYQAKAAGRNAIRFFDPRTQAAIDARILLEHDLHRALACQEFELYYQPQVNLQGRLVGAEALLRWASPKRGMTAPAEFLPLAEETGFILQLGDWVLQRACEMLKRWSESARTSHLSLAVNISRVQLQHPEFVKRTLRIVEESGVDPGRLNFEVTENALFPRIDDAIGKMNELKKHGIHFCLEDFGTGYSSISTLRRLPIDQVKIDRSFISRITAGRQDTEMAKTVAMLGQLLALDVLAEGVETEDQRGFLASTGYGGYQGYLFSAPVASSKISSFTER